MKWLIAAKTSLPAKIWEHGKIIYQINKCSILNVHNAGFLAFFSC